jgi:hypothetical protein
MKKKRFSFESYFYIYNYNSNVFHTSQATALRSIGLLCPVVVPIPITPREPCIA